MPFDSTEPSHLAVVVSAVALCLAVDYLRRGLPRQRRFTRFCLMAAMLSIMAFLYVVIVHGF